MFTSDETLNKGLLGVINMNIDSGEASVDEGEVVVIRPTRIKGPIRNIILTPKSQATIWVDSKTDTTFVVKADKAVSFYWLAIGD